MIKRKQNTKNINDQKETEQQATFAYRATKQQLRYVENICPPHVAEFYFQLFTFIKHMLLHNMRMVGF
jgi:hypothetical protein